MAKIIRLHRLAPRTPPQHLDAHRFLTVCIETIEKQLYDARADKDQEAIEELLPQLAFARRELRALPVADLER